MKMDQHEQQTEPDQDRSKGRKREEEERERLTRRMIEEAAKLAHSDAAGNFRSDVWGHGISQMARMKHFPKPLFAGFGGGGPGSASLVGAQWTQVGPAPLRANFGAGPLGIAGRVYDIAIDPSGVTDQKIYLATVGGIWKSADGGTTWAPKTDRL